jgi:hypothetical protein
LKRFEPSFPIKKGIDVRSDSADRDLLDRMPLYCNEMAGVLDFLQDARNAFAGGVEASGIARGFSVVNRRADLLELFGPVFNIRFEADNGVNSC